MRIRKPIHVAVLLLSFLFPLPLASQVRGRITRTSLSRMDVLSRAALFEGVIADAAKKEGVDPLILWTIAYNETRFRPWLTSPKNAQGLMQFIPATAARFGLQNPYEPHASIYAAARYVSVLSGMFGGRLESILAAYNAGEGTVAAFLNGHTLRTGRKLINANRKRTHGGVPPYTETIGYVGRGVKVYRWLERSGRLPELSIRSNFPTLVSASIARIPLVDPELATLPLAELQNSERSRNATRSLARAVVYERPSSTEKRTQTQPIPEVFYDPRSGNRYVSRNGEIIRKLGETGQVIISPENRSVISSQARTTLVSVPVKK
jgi:hypothetical protein